MILRLAAMVAALAPLACPGFVSFQGPIYVSGASHYSGTVFTTSEFYGPADRLSIIVKGTVDLASGYLYPGSLQYSTNAAGIVVQPDVTHLGTAVGSVLSEYGALYVGNDLVGFKRLFQPDASNGLGSSDPPTTLLCDASLQDLFGPGFDGLAKGSALEFRVWDPAVEDNTGEYVVTMAPSVPEPGSSLILVLGLGALWIAKIRG